MLDLLRREWHIPKSPQDLANIHLSAPERIPMGLDCEGAKSREDIQKTKLVKRELINMKLNIPTKTLRDSANMLLGWLLESWRNRWTHICCGRWWRKESKGSENWICSVYILWKVRKLTIWLCSVKEPGKEPEDVTFIKSTRDSLLRAEPTSLKISGGHSQ